MKEWMTTRMPYEILVGLVIGVITLLVIFPPEQYMLRLSVDYAVPFIFGFLTLGLLCLFLKLRTVTFMSFICCGILCFFLRSGRFVYAAANDSPSISIAQFNLSETNDYEGLISGVKSAQADVIAFHELTPGWKQFLIDSLGASYPYYNVNVRIDLFGAAVFSKHQLKNLGSFDFRGVPNMTGTITVDSSEFELQFVLSHMTPIVNTAAYSEVRDHFDTLAVYVNSLQGPVIAFGNYNTVPWSSEVKSFTSQTELQNSPLDFTPTFQSSALPIFQLPLDHIFYSDDFECTAFQTVGTAGSPHVGIYGRYQLKPRLLDDALKPIF